MFIELVCKKLPVSLQSKKIVNNIANKCSFSLRMLRTSKAIEIKYEKTGKKTYKHERLKKTLYSKDSSVFNFMLRSLHDDLSIVDGPTLNISAELV